MVFPHHKNKKDQRWVIYSNNVEATKITSDWFMWMHHTIDKIPDNNNQKYIWQKKHLENKTGSQDSYKPTKIIKVRNCFIVRYHSELFFREFALENPIFPPKLSF
mgnify:FL=1